jgi:hypothetical protein
MASIVGENKYRNAEGKGWAVTDKIFGYIDEVVNIYNKGRTGAVEGDVSFDPELGVPPKELGIFGLEKPWGGVILVGGLGLVGFGLYKLLK